MGKLFSDEDEVAALKRELSLSLHKVKLMKMLWYGDNVSYKRRGKSITGLVYSTLPMDAVIAEVGHLNSQEIIDKMHDEDAYKCTDRNCIIPFSHAEKLSIH